MPVHPCFGQSFSVFTLNVGGWSRPLQCLNWSQGASRYLFSVYLPPHPLCRSVKGLHMFHQVEEVVLDNNELTSLQLSWMPKMHALSLNKNKVRWLLKSEWSTPHYFAKIIYLQRIITEWKKKLFWTFSTSITVWARNAVIWNSSKLFFQKFCCKIC